MDHSEIVGALRDCEFFSNLEESHVREIADLCRGEVFDAGACVFRQGDFGEHLYVISEGHVFLERELDLGSKEGKIVLGTLGKGRVFGCWSTLLGEPHNLMSSATCQKPTTLLILKGADLRAMMIENAVLGLCVLERLCYLLRDRIQGAYGAMEKI